MKKTRIDRFKVRQRMEQKQIDTYKDLAASGGVHENTIGNALDSYSWKSATLDAIANALGVDSCEILTTDDVADSIT